MQNERRSFWRPFVNIGKYRGKLEDNRGGGSYLKITAHSIANSLSLSPIRYLFYNLVDSFLRNLRPLLQFLVRSGGAPT